jgi:hypothetical protein
MLEGIGNCGSKQDGRSIGVNRPIQYGLVRHVSYTQEKCKLPVGIKVAIAE